MAHFATKRFNYWGQLGILMAFCGVGMIVGGFVSLIPIADKISLKEISNGDLAILMEKLMVPENATRLRWMQFISTLFLFFLPALFYAVVCHKKPSLNLGFKHSVSVPQIIVLLLLVIACMPVVDTLQALTLKFPWSKATLQQFSSAEVDYNKEISVIARMNNISDYIISMIMIAFLPAVFEETFFRGGVQNLLSRWFKMPVPAIIITAIIFSAVHGSYLGFLSRAALGFILGWIYYRTGNIWLNIIAHFFNNAIGVTLLYFSKVEIHLPWWSGFVSVAAVYGLLILFEKVSKKDIDRPGQEVPVPGYIDMNNPFLAGVENIGRTDQSKF